MPVCDRIKEAMKKRGYSQNRLAKAAQISQSGLSSILSGASSPKENTLRAIADALGVSISELTEEESTIENDEEWKFREFMRREPEYRELMDAAFDADPEHVRAAIAVINSLKKTKR